MMFPFSVLAIACLPMLGEAALSRRNETRLRALGATEPPGDVYTWMQVIYPTCFVAMALEGWLRDRVVTRTAITGAIVFSSAKALKYWAIASLGIRWSFRVLVPPGSERTSRGPYRYLRHPNYVAVAGELTGMALLAQAPIAGPVSLIVFGGLLLARIRVEERALGIRHG